MPGLANRRLAPIVRAAAVTFESTREFFGKKAFVSGNPVRAECFQAGEPPRAVREIRWVPQVHGIQGAHGVHEEGAHDRTSDIRVLIFGGSQGAHAINVAMVEAAAELAGRARLRLTHQTGERDVELVRAAYRAAGLQADVEPFLYDMGRQLRQADLIVCRAGSTTLAEVAAAGKAAILVPLPTATDDHQRVNAEVLVSVGAAQLLPQSDMTGAELARRILALADDRDARDRIRSRGARAGKTGRSQGDRRSFAGAGEGMNGSGPRTSSC